METDLGVGSIGVAQCDEWKTAWARRDVYKPRNAVKLLTMGDIFLLGTGGRVEEVSLISSEVK